MSIDSQTIDRIVAGVLKQLGAAGDRASVGVASETQSCGKRAVQQVSCEASLSPASSHTVVLKAGVVTADVLLNAAGDANQIVVPRQSIVTPAAWDAAKARNIEVVREADHSAKPFTRGANPEANPSSSTPAALFVVVRHTDAVERLWADLNSVCRREDVACPDDAAALAVSAICRGDAVTIVIFAEQSHRSACRANRNEQVKAVVVRDANDVRAVRNQLRANVWCVDPTGCSWFELRQLYRAIVRSS